MYLPDLERARRKVLPERVIELPGMNRKISRVDSIQDINEPPGYTGVANLGVTR